MVTGVRLSLEEREEASGAATGKMDRRGVDAVGLVRAPHGGLREGLGGELHERPEGRPVVSPVVYCSV